MKETGSLFSEIGVAGMPAQGRLRSCLLAALLGVTGCAHSSYTTCETQCGSSMNPPPELPSAERGLLLPNWNKSAGSETPSGPGANSFAYRGIDLGQCQRLAAQHAGLANLLDTKRRSLAEAPRKHKLLGHGEKCRAQTQEAILFHAALESRNQEAGTALELFYHLVEAEAQGQLLERGLAQLDQSVAQAESVRKQGLRLPVDPSVLRRQRLELESQAVQLRLTVAKLNSELQRRLGYDPEHAYWHFWPTCDFPLGTEAVDVDAAVARGLESRSELVLLRQLQQELNKENLPAVRSLMAASNPLLGAADESSHLPLVSLVLRLCGGKNQSEVEAARSQLTQSLEEQQRKVIAEIHLAALTARAQLQLAGLAKRRVQSWHETVHDLEIQRDKGIVSFVEVTRASLELWKAEGEFVKEVMAWHIATAKLRQAQGLLALDCECSEQQPPACPSKPDKLP